MGVPIKYHNGIEWVLIDAGAIVDSNGNRITADNITDHISNDASLSQKGHVQLSSSTNSIDETMAATPKAVKDVKDASIPLMQKGVAYGIATLNSNGMLEQKPYITGYYIGDGVSTRTINLGFQPSAVLIMPVYNSVTLVGMPQEFFVNSSFSGTNTYSVYGGLFLPSDTYISFDYDGATTTFSPISVSYPVQFSATGFTVKNQSTTAVIYDKNQTINVYLNNTSYKYKYVVFS